MNKLAVWLALIVLAVATGCATAQRASYRSLGITAVSVDAAMQSWARYVNAGHATPEQVAAVKTAYEQYYAAMQVALDLGRATAGDVTVNESLLQSAVRVVAECQAHVVALIQALISEGGASAPRQP